jgi:hypothetical protein
MLLVNNSASVALFKHRHFAQVRQNDVSVWIACSHCAQDCKHMSLYHVMQLYIERAKDLWRQNDAQVWLVSVMRRVIERVDAANASGTTLSGAADTVIDECDEDDTVVDAPAKLAALRRRIDAIYSSSAVRLYRHLLASDCATALDCVPDRVGGEIRSGHASVLIYANYDATRALDVIPG